MFCATQNLWAMKSGCLAKAISKQCWRSSLVLYCFQWNTRKKKLFHTIFIHMHTQVGNYSDKRRRKSCHLQQHGWTLRALRGCDARVLSHVWLFAAPRTVAHQAPPSMGLSRQKYANNILVLLEKQLWPEWTPYPPFHSRCPETTRSHFGNPWPSQVFASLSVSVSQCCLWIIVRDLI